MRHPDYRPTVGHASEAVLGCRAITHGGVVAHGMLVASGLSVRRGLCVEGDVPRFCILLKRFGSVDALLPSPESLKTSMVNRMNARDGVLQFVLTRGVGSVTFAPVLIGMNFG